MGGGQRTPKCMADPVVVLNKSNVKKGNTISKFHFCNFGHRRPDKSNETGISNDGRKENKREC